ncbi:gastrin/cholecystokinin type B receptor-like [Haliotis rubra]|uniref:gastrin/cholecystokinin type B receptor-like n=1 Tax=Haliotis rubra TaxID=36100 RepID=UPI001EE5F461|nr:gastrin/cholecystokinin type B receptor-like [Haliotis rubra]
MTNLRDVNLTIRHSSYSLPMSGDRALVCSEVDMGYNASISSWNLTDNDVHTNSAYIDNTTSSVAKAIPEMPLYILVTSTLLYVIIFLTGTIGNSVVAAVVGLRQDMRTSTNLFLVNLAVADLMVITVCMPTALVDIYAKDIWHFGATMCTLVPMLENCAAHASVLTMMVIASERFQAICHPLRIRDTKIYSKSMKLFIVIFIWFISMLTSMPFIGISVYRDSSYYDGTPIKVCRQSIVLPWQKGYIVCLCVVFFTLPFVVLGILYLIIARALVREFRFSDKLDEQRCHSKNKARRRVVIMLVIITLLFFFFHLPFRTVGMWMIFASPAKVRALGFEGFWNLLCFARIMFYLNSCTNPIVYSLISTKFRRAFIRTCLGKRRSVSRENTCTTAGTHISLKVMHK